MANFDIIRRVSGALASQLTAHLAAIAGTPQARLHNLQPPPGAGHPVLTIFLYDVVEDATMRNRPPVMSAVAGGAYTSKRADLPLVLRYMLTPWSDDPATAQLMLGCAAQALFDSKSLLGADLSGGLQSELELVSVNLIQLTLEEKAKIWWAIQQPYHVSLNYDVRVVGIAPLPPVTVVGPPVGDRAHVYAPVEPAGVGP